MFRNFMKVAVRNLQRHKAYSFINIVGLAVGMACCMLIMLWVVDEVSYDNFHENGNNVYRILSTGRYFKSGFDGSPAPLAPAALREIPAIKSAVRFMELPRTVCRAGDKAFYEERGILTEQAFFDIFSFPLVAGDPKTALSDPAGIVISEDLARKYFGNENPLGKTIEADGKYLMKVSGIMKTIPANSS
ncbi:MAG: ABC transporter permease, partial [Candidatus Zixiibacteriota bacterium]